MADDLTNLTELSTALGMLGYPSIDAALEARPPCWYLAKGAALSDHPR
ncbi:MAG: hypothetical protein ACRDX8_03005 [Acidimicrobiales bacterium]